MYVNASQGEGDMDGPWNSGQQWDRVDDLAGSIPMDGGAGVPTVGLAKADVAALGQLAARTMSNPASEPTTGADLGAGPGAGRTSNGDMGAAANVTEASAMADATAAKTAAKSKVKPKGKGKAK